MSFHFRTSGLQDEGVRNTADVLPFFYLPAIEHMSASIDNPLQFQWPAIHGPTPSRLTSLHLKVVRESLLRRILLTATGLEKLRWEWCYKEPYGHRHSDPNMNRFGTNILDLDDIVQTLPPVKDTLTDLTIFAASDMSYARPFYPPLTLKGSLRDLRGFSAIRRLDLPMPFLFGFSPDVLLPLEPVLPRNIEFLTISHDLLCQDENEMEASTVVMGIESWLEKWRESTPHLRGISFVIDETDSEWGPDSDMQEEINQLCRSAGIQVKFRNWDRWGCLRYKWVPQ